MSGHQIGSTENFYRKERSKEPVRDQIMLSQHSTIPVLAVTKDIQKNLLQTEKLRRTDPTLLQLPLSETS